MPRKKRIYKNKEFLRPDPKFGNLMLSRFINQIMRRGKKSIAQKVVYGALDIVSEKTKDDPLMVFDAAIRNVAPVLEVKGKRIGGANYQIAQEVRGDRRETLAMRWLKEAARTRSGKAMAEKLAAELIDASKKEGGAMKRREEVHRMAEANRAFSHFAR
ncbi:MAG: 30S ribosomal protein S7 [Candidatus Andersenbacteria bacterium RIFCSPHIGHO2_12_FULL_46_9]|nr:MAG: 30S ribosomal protein S7 [Parcubacteria group bacterium GW2011_GWA2_45_14]OGY35618.1 MAG: 30S ribosomal protein S7 [Candidatus Andersenbacteria bacterium RIFCSPHIGHO2_02_FULL_46_16]OGY36821.1 MAG: 30S ribosomal protein S7 [Candidatus Andersenbacteria bacterium RIFCSPLOWO2_02_FULL_46_11]OGY37170.1 MAG: 30S ribosomal protein S7 [Candidatus Andersenbacteria bacterium RIFCSPHIGHO2_12_FULL_46_9]OGY42083.1 MAG: 30S ribosomal protein S7 [Candidatus Andersenbacteria bacterium RIFCSPLOWO2_12_FUL